jgi:regulatory protein
MQLFQKKIGEKLIAKCWDEIVDSDYQKELEKQYDNYFSKQKGMKEYQKKQKTIKYLLSRGFEYDCILNVKNS